MPATVLLIEDSPGDQELTRRAFEDDVLRVDLRIVEDGEQALDYLHRKGAYSDAAHAPRPDIILLDLNLPKIDGRDVLERVKGDLNLSDIPVVVLTTSDAEAEVVKSYQLGCNSFITKPVGFEGFAKAIRDLEDYWLELVRLPRSAHV